MISLKNCLVALMLIFAVLRTVKAPAQQSITDTTALETVLIKSASIVEKMKDIPASVSVMTTTELNRAAPALLTTAFNRKAGIYVQDGALNTNRISIRGIGARAQYGTNRVKAYFNEIPISTADGETVINDFDLESIDRVEITKGPNASMYGSGLGGVIHLFPKLTAVGHDYLKTASDFGSFGMRKYTVNVGHADYDKSFFATYNHLQSDGFRENSNFDRKSFTLHGKINSGTYSSLSFFGNFTRLKGYIASSISATDFENNPEVAATNWREAQGYESYDRLISGLAYSFRFSDKLTNTSSVFLNYRDAYEPRPFDILKQQSVAIGARTRFNLEVTLLGVSTKISFGGEYLSESYSGSNFENLYQSYPGQGSVQGSLFADVSQQRNYYNFFSQINLQLTDKLILVTGLNSNSTNYSLEDSFEEGPLTPSGAYTFKTIWSPRVAATYALTENKSVYLNASKGFSIPTVDETLTPEGRINTSLQPETGWNYEIGFKGSWIKNLYTEVALYTIQVANLLVARRTAEDQYVGINAGKTDHTGLELLLNYKWQLTPSITVQPYFSGSFHHYRFDEFIDDGNDFSSNLLTGVPESTLNFGVDVFAEIGFSFFSNILYVSEIPLNDANTVFSNSYKVVDLKIAYRFEPFKNLETQLSFGINNVLDEKYAASILPNAIGFGASEPRYFYPGNPRNVFGGISLYYSF
jgi:iron complex outermembrane receptor protein